VLENHSSADFTTFGTTPAIDAQHPRDAASAAVAAASGALARVARAA
jgi:hypothetical protein